MADNESLLKIIGGAIVGSATLVATMFVAYDYGRDTVGAKAAEMSARIVALETENKNLADQLAAAQSGLVPATPTSTPEPVGSTAVPADEEAVTQAGTNGAIPDLSPTVPNPQVIEVEGFRFALQGCRADSADVLCSVLVTNLEEDRKLSVRRQTRLLDTAGDSHRQCARIHGAAAAKSLDLVVDLPTGVPSRIQVKFCGIAQVVQKISLLELDCRGLKVQWRDIEVGGD